MDDRRLERIDDQYDANRDVVSGGPLVTWAEHLLATVCDELLDEVAKLRKRVDHLETVVQGQQERYE
jgi:hypothetical protein